MSAEDEALDLPRKVPDWKNINCTTYSVERFFAMCIEQWSCLQWLPRLEAGHCTAKPLRHRRELSNCPNKDALRMRIMTDAGWPAKDGLGTGWNCQEAERGMDAHYEEILRPW